MTGADRGIRRVVTRMVSGGQTGADRAALDAARAAGVDHGGWCPAGGWAEDLPDPPGLLAAYPTLRATASADPAVRTRWNVRDSDATLVLRLRTPSTSGPGSAGTDLTVRTAAELGRPCLAVTLEEPDAARTAVRRWVESLPPGTTLNVAGPRESEEPGLYAAARTLLDALLVAPGPGEAGAVRM